MAEITTTTFCRICEALCGLEVTLDDGEIVRIRPDAEHVATRGYGCVKGLKQQKMYASPDRLARPMKRVGDDYVPVSWEQANREIGEKVRRLRRERGPRSIAMYVGTAAGFGVLHPVFAQAFMMGIGSPSMFSSATQDCANKFAVATEMYGFPFSQPFPDVERTRCLIVVGANPAISKWSFLQVSNPIERLREIEARGGKVYFVDPRRTESAKVAGEHVFIRPNTDVFFYLSFLNEVIAQGGVKGERVERYMTGFDEVAAMSAVWPAERTAEVTRVPAETLRAMVRDYLGADGAALYSSTGVNMGTHGSIAFWLQECINAVTGNLDRLGGTLVGQGIIDFAAFGKKTGLFGGNVKSRIGEFSQVNDAFPGGILADEILTPGEGQIRALFVTGGNPLLTMANGARLRRAFEDLELIVVLDVHMSETASMAHYVLPCTTPLERPDLPFAFPLLMGMQSRPYLQATRRVVKPKGEQRDEATIYLDLARASGIGLWGSKIAQRAFELIRALHSMRHRDEQPAVPQEWLLDLILRLTKQPRFRELLAHPHGWLRPDHTSENFLGARVTTSDGKVHLAPDALARETQTLEADFERERRDARRLKLITRRAITTHNSWTHNLEDFVAGDRATNYLYMHPDDARAAGIGEDDLADVRTATNAVRVPVRLLADLMPGTVALPHGWGHQASRNTIAKKTRGVNVNLLAADGPEALERVSGMAHLTGIVVDVSKADAPQDVTTWSGIPERDGSAQ
jgi:anaerobic selenocysteine-containing dehydrogenase